MSQFVRNDPWVVLVPHIAKSYPHVTKDDATARASAVSRMFEGSTVAVDDDLRIITVDAPKRECCP